VTRLLTELLEVSRLEAGRLQLHLQQVDIRELSESVVTELATQHSPAGLVLRSPFVDLASVGRVHYPFLPVGRLLVDRYPVAEQLRRVTVPTVVVYGTRDAIVPAMQSRRVADAAGGPVRVVPVAGADHNDIALLDGPQLIGAVVSLADDVCA